MPTLLPVLLLPVMLLTGLVLGSPALAADPDTPHPHRLIAPVTAKPAALDLNADEQATLDNGGVVVRSKRTDLGGEGQAVQLVSASANDVWDAILDYPQYPERVSTVVSTTVYERDGDTFYVDMKSSIMGYETVLYSRNALHRDEGWMAWSLDYQRTSDVKDIAGYWRVEQLQDSPPLTRLEHSTALAISGVPGFLVKYLTRQSLADGVAWVKKAAEGS